MFELKISGLGEAVLLSSQWATHTISLLDPDVNRDITNFPTASKNGLLQRYYFSDVYRHHEANFLGSVPKFASTEQIIDILQFTAGLKSTDKLLVHCHAGISRSTAVACGILCQHGLSPADAFKRMLSIRPQALPNQHILALFDELLKLKGKLVSCARY